MKSILLVMIFLISSVASLVAADAPLYLQIEPMIGDGRPAAGRSVASGCYLEPGENCEGLFYLNDGGFGSRTGSLVCDVTPAPTFEVLYSLTVRRKSGREMLVGTAYAMQLSDGNIVGGEKTEIEQVLPPGDEIVMAQPVSRLPSGETFFFQISGSRHPAERSAIEGGHLVTLISTKVGEGRLSQPVRNWHSKSAESYLFRAGFKSEPDGHCRLLRYDVEVNVDCDADLEQLSRLDASRLPVSGRVHVSRKYSIDTVGCDAGSFTPTETYVSGYAKSVEFRPGEIIKLIFPADTPSVRGFAIEDTLIILPR